MNLRPEARRAILVAAWEEDTVLDLLRRLQSDFGHGSEVWLAAIAEQARRGALEAYRQGRDEGHAFVDVDACALHPGDLGAGYVDAVYLCRTDATLPTILSLPHPDPDDPLRIVGIWPGS